MDNGWFDRLVDAIIRDGRDMKAISLAAGLGQNYVQQMVKDRKKPKIDTLVRLLNELGRADTLWIITGQEFTDADRALLEVAASLEDEGKRKLIEAFAALAAAQQ